MSPLRTDLAIATGTLLNFQICSNSYLDICIFVLFLEERRASKWLPPTPETQAPHQARGNAGRHPARDAHCGGQSPQLLLKPDCTSRPLGEPGKHARLVPAARDSPAAHSPLQTQTATFLVRGEAQAQPALPSSGLPLARPPGPSLSSFCRAQRPWQVSHSQGTAETSGFRLSQAQEPCPHAGGTMKTKGVTLPPLFPCWDGHPLAAGRPSRERAAQAELLRPG